MITDKNQCDNARRTTNVSSYQFAGKNRNSGTGAKEMRVFNGKIVSIRRQYHFSRFVMIRSTIRHSGTEALLKGSTNGPFTNNMIKLNASDWLLKVFYHWSINRSHDYTCF